MKYYTYRMTALLLAALLMVASVAPYAVADVVTYDTETGYPLLADVRSLLDEDEIVSVDDVSIVAGDSFNPGDISAFKLESSGKAVEKATVVLFAAHTNEGSAFAADVPGSYTAYYVVTPTSDHPAYEVSRKIIVKAAEPAVPVAAEADEDTADEETPDGEDDSEDGQYEEQEIAAAEAETFDDEGEYEVESDVAEEIPEQSDETGSDAAETDPPEPEEESEAADDAGDEEAVESEYGDNDEFESVAIGETSVEDSSDNTEDNSEQISEPAPEILDLYTTLLRKELERPPQERAAEKPIAREESKPRQEAKQEPSKPAKRKNEPSL